MLLADILKGLIFEPLRIKASRWRQVLGTINV